MWWVEEENDPGERNRSIWMAGWIMEGEVENRVDGKVVEAEREKRR